MKPWFRLVKHIFRTLRSRGVLRFAAPPSRRPYARSGIHLFKASKFGMLLLCHEIAQFAGHSLLALLCHKPYDRENAGTSVAMHHP